MRHPRIRHALCAAVRMRRFAENGHQQRALEDVHVEFAQQHPNLIANVLHGLRKSARFREYVTELLNLLPEQAIINNSHLAAEALRYAGYWSNQDLVRKLLNALHHPLYDESFDPQRQPSSFNFSTEMWSAILYAHVQLGLINSSRLILQSMQ